MGDSVNKLIRASEETNQMIHIAELENYMSGNSDIPVLVGVFIVAMALPIFDMTCFVMIQLVDPCEVI